jgi:hypothetical protein
VAKVQIETSVENLCWSEECFPGKTLFSDITSKQSGKHIGFIFLAYRSRFAGILFSEVINPHLDCCDEAQESVQIHPKTTCFVLEIVERISKEVALKGGKFMSNINFTKRVFPFKGQKTI